MATVEASPRHSPTLVYLRYPPTVKERGKIWVLINKTIKPFVLQDERLR